MHGSLIGWYWNGKILPWDDDLDVQVSEPSMAFLAAYYNMTVHHYSVKIPPEATGDAWDEAGRDYLLEINPNWTNNSTEDKHNVIDARWIDMTTGLFIDITALRYNQTSEDLGEGTTMFCKDKHTYMSKSIFPLRESEYEGRPVKVPYSYAELLEEDYGKKVMTKTRWEGHYFNDVSREWVIDGLP
jgi:phosphorylcholine metabolism protein LicD